MAPVTVRDAQRGDAAGIAEVVSATEPWTVCSAARMTADLRADSTMGRRRWVALVAGQVVATAQARQVLDRDGEREVVASINVHPDHGSRGIGTTLLTTLASAFPGITWLRGETRDEPISMSFAVRNGFLPEGEQPVLVLDPAEVDEVGPEPDGLRPVTLDALPDLRMLLATHNGAASADPSGRTPRITMYQLRADWWDSPDNAPDLSFGLLADGTSGPDLAAFCSVQADREHSRARTTITAIHPAYHGRRLGRWVTLRTLNALAEAGVSSAWTAPLDLGSSDLARERDLGYRPAERVVQVGRRLGTRVSR